MTVEIHHEALRFLIAGAVNTMATYALYLGLLHWMSYTPAYTIAYICGIALAYALNTRFVFRVTRTLAKAMAYPMVYVAQYLVGAMVLNLAVRAFGVPERFALLASIAITVPLTFLLSRQILAARRTPPAMYAESNHD